MKTIQAIKRLPIRAYLAERGLHPTKDNPRYGLYLSPLRKEHTPSFKVDYVQNLWYDFGLGAGGSIINLVMRLERCDFTQALRLLGSGERTQMAVRVPSSVPPSGISQLPFLAGDRSGNRTGLLSGSALRRRRTQLFRCRIPQRCRRLGAAFGTVQRVRFTQTHYHNRQPFRCRRHIRGIYGFSVLPFDKAGRMAAYRRCGAELGRPSSESNSVSRTACDDSCVLR